jgi:four helix bundle protein
MPWSTQISGTRQRLIVWWNRDCHSAAVDLRKSQSDQLEERLIEFAARVIEFSTTLPRTPAGRHIAMQILRSGTAAAPNYAEARGAESMADFVHKLGIVQKELNETSVWLRIISRISLGKDDLIVAILRENVELARIIGASIRTAKARSENDK